MNEVISVAIAAVGAIGSMCSILAFGRDCLIEFRRRKRSKMIGRRNRGE
ncbi:MAG: hypothetical protein IJ087_05875 [Eggerthellaceae bacterium]|nr:hypothetical protein [Eggerthellaceae bacterium]